LGSFLIAIPEINHPPGEFINKNITNSIFYTEIYHETHNMICDLATNLST
jgi:hypothetical protein